jgi:hypothetical protein
MRDVAGWLSAGKTACQHGYGYREEGQNTAAEICSSAMSHPGLGRPNPAVLFVVQSAMNGCVEAARRKVGLNPGINGLGVMLIKPRIQLLQLLRRERIDCAFDLLDGFQV